MSAFKFDHIAVSAENLKDGVEYVEECLGVRIPYGGAHPIMGTHNHLMRLSNDTFLEIIAIDPDAALPERPRWFNLDNFSGDPRLTVWVLGTTDLTEALQSLPLSIGRKTRITRGDLEWHISVPEDGSLPYDGAFPVLIEWPSARVHPASNMADLGCRLDALEITHPEGAYIGDTLSEHFVGDTVTISTGPMVKMEAAIQTPNGIRHIK